LHGDASSKQHAADKEALKAKRAVSGDWVDTKGWWTRPEFEDLPCVIEESYGFIFEKGQNKIKMTSLDTRLYTTTQINETYYYYYRKSGDRLKKTTQPECILPANVREHYGVSPYIKILFQELSTAELRAELIDRVTDVLQKGINKRQGGELISAQYHADANTPHFEICYSKINSETHKLYPNKPRAISTPHASEQSLGKLYRGLKLGVLHPALADKVTAELDVLFNSKSKLKEGEFWFADILLEADREFESFFRTHLGNQLVDEVKAREKNALPNFLINEEIRKQDEEIKHENDKLRISNEQQLKELSAARDMINELSKANNNKDNQLKIKDEERDMLEATKTLEFQDLAVQFLKRGEELVRLKGVIAHKEASSVGVDAAFAQLSSLTEALKGHYELMVKALLSRDTRPYIPEEVRICLCKSMTDLGLVVPASLKTSNADVSAKAQKLFDKNPPSSGLSV